MASQFTFSTLPTANIIRSRFDRDSQHKTTFNLGDIITENEYEEVFGDFIHPFTGINMVHFYRDLVKKENCEIEFVFANDPRAILNYTKDVLNCDIHTRERTKKILKESGADTVYGLYEKADSVL